MLEGITSDMFHFNWYVEIVPFIQTNDSLTKDYTMTVA